MVVQTLLIPPLVSACEPTSNSQANPWYAENGQTIVPAPLTPNNGDSQHKSGSKISINDRRRIFRQIIVKCVLQLLLIETTNDLLRNDEVYNTIPPEHLLRLMGVLDHSYQFARMFNDDKELRTGLWKVGAYSRLRDIW